MRRWESALHILKQAAVGVILLGMRLFGLLGRLTRPSEVALPQQPGNLIVTKRLRRPAKVVTFNTAMAAAEKGPDS